MKKNIHLIFKKIAFLKKAFWTLREIEIKEGGGQQQKGKTQEKSVDHFFSPTLK